MLGRSRRAVAVRWNGGGNKAHLFKPEALGNFFCKAQVREVNRVERTSEQACGSHGFQRLRLALAGQSPFFAAVDLFELRGRRRGQITRTRAALQQHPADVAEYGVQVGDEARAFGTVDDAVVVGQ